ncbi:MAG: hypothetical protein D6780_06235 [Candidatus Dadabacteria bacterium]|nr:MAG: hypothetical protein D6780_06235 [Candidatus Dadabacteria bacterium]
MRKEQRVKFNCRAKSKGITLLELLVVFSVVGILLGLALYGIRGTKNPLSNAVFSIEQFIRLARAKAISGTQAVKIFPTSDTTLQASAGESCTSELTDLSDLTLTLPKETSLGDTSWSICFNARGIADTSISFTVVGPNSSIKTIKVALGGGVKIE